MIRFRVGDSVYLEEVEDDFRNGQLLRGRPAATGRILEIGPMPGVWPNGAPQGALCAFRPLDGSAPYNGWVGADLLRPPKPRAM